MPSPTRQTKDIPRWFVIVGVLAVVYAVWLKLLDKRRVKDILLFGSLLSIGYVLADLILGSFLGFYAYRISIFPFKPSIFIVSITIAPIMFMLVLQYTSSWRSFMLWGTIGTVVLSFGLVPLYVHMDILKFYKGWNYFLSFLRTFTGGMIARAMFLWLSGIEKRQPASSRVYQGYSGLQLAAAKPLNEKNRDDLED